MDSISAKKLIAVEGKDDELFIKALLDYLSIIDVQVMKVDGVSNFRNILLALKNIPGFNGVKICAFIRDADTNPPNSAFQSLVDSIRTANMVPPQRDQSFSDSNPRVGIYILPGNGNPGMLEDLCLQSLSGDRRIRCVDSYFSCLETNPSNLSKAKILCFLSGQESYVNLLGYAAMRGMLDFSNPAFESITSFLEHFR